MSIVVKSADVAERLFLSHSQLKKLVKEHNVLHRTDGKGGYILGADAEEQLSKLMMTTTRDKANARARNKAVEAAAKTRDKNKKKASSTR